MSTQTLLTVLFYTMRQTTAQLMRLVSRNTLGNAKVLPALNNIKIQGGSTTFNHLTEQREEAGEAWPKNIRLEPMVKKEAFQRVQADIRTRLKRLLRET